MSIKSNQKPFPERDSSGKPLMTEEFICKLCEYNSGYSTPSYNFTCYLHFFGFSKIENLTNFTNLRVLYLENNHLQKIENLSHLTNLECLYLQHNYITKIENLEHNKALVNLNLSENKITKIENLSCLPSLENLYLSKNFLKTASDISHITSCPSISLLDIQFNQIETNEPQLFTVLASIPNLKVLYFKGNEVIRSIRNYRRVMILKLPALTYLDDRPVKIEDKIGAKAYIEQGGYPAEAKARKEYYEQHDKVVQIRQHEREEMMKMPFSEKKMKVIQSVNKEYIERRNQIKEKMNMIKNKYENEIEMWDEMNLILNGLKYQLHENNVFRDNEEKFIALTMGKRERSELMVSFKYEKWMDEIVEVCVIENFMNFNDAVKMVWKEFEKRGVKNWELFNVMDLRRKWSELEMEKFRKMNGSNNERMIRYLDLEEVFDEKEVDEIYNKAEERDVKIWEGIQEENKKGEKNEKEKEENKVEKEEDDSSSVPITIQQCELDELD